MKRRDFNKAALATLVTAAGQPLAAALPQKRGVFERIRAIPETHRNVIGVGIGHEGRRLAWALNTLLDPERQGFIYADTTESLDTDNLVPPFVQGPYDLVTGESGYIQEWMEALLMFSLDDSAAWPRVVAWSRRFKQDARLRVAIVSVHGHDSALSHPLIRWLNAEMDIVIRHPSTDGMSYPTLFNPIVQTALVFFETRRLPAYDCLDAQHLFSKAGTAIVTTSLIPPKDSGGSPVFAAESCLKQLRELRPQKLFSTLFGGLDMSISNWHSSSSVLERCLLDDALYLNTFLPSRAVPVNGHQLLHAIWVLPEHLGPTEG